MDLRLRLQRPAVQKVEVAPFVGLGDPLGVEGAKAPRGLDRAAAEELALASEKVQRLLDGNPPRKVIVVPDRLVNIVA